MSERELARRARLWARRLGIGHYRIELVIGATEDSDHIAEAKRTTPYEEATLIFQPWTVGQGAPPEGAKALTDELLEQTLVHELLHVAVKPMFATLALLEDHLHPAAAALFAKAFEDAEERVVDRLAWALVRDRRNRV